MEQWFPGFTDELVAGEVQVEEAEWNFRWWQDGQALAGLALPLLPRG